MLKFSAERTPELSPVDEMLGRVAGFGYVNVDDYIERVRAYLEFAKQCGLESQAVVDSSIDLAETLTTIPELVDSRRAKTEQWEARRRAALAVERPPRLIDMELDPVYFAAILTEKKSFEGRAYKPDSDKDYPDIRAGDLVRFRLSQRDEGFVADMGQRDLRPEDVMVCTVRDVFFAPTVHGMYQNGEIDGEAFQPMLNGPSEVIQLQRAAVYHTFPGYNQIIRDHGFLGIQVENPYLV